jgi:uncharacterized protein
MLLTVLKMLGILVLIYGGLLLFVVGCQRKMIYFPSQGSEERLLKEANAKGMTAWRNAEEELIGWKASPVEGAENGNAVVVFHGNAGYALHRDYFVDGFLSLNGQSSWTIYIFEYPGYGARPGRPSEEKLKSTAGDAVKGLFKKQYSRIFLVGESIGTGVACHLANKFPERIDGLLLITPFTSFVDVGQKHYPIFPVGLLLQERYNNLEALQGYNGPVAFLIAGADEIIPPSLGRRLYEAYNGPKRLWVQEGRGHNTLDYHPKASWWREVTEFLRNPDSGA